VRMYAIGFNLYVLSYRVQCPAGVEKVSTVRKISTRYKFANIEVSTRYKFAYNIYCWQISKSHLDISLCIISTYLFHAEVDVKFNALM